MVQTNGEKSGKNSFAVVQRIVQRVFPISGAMSCPRPPVGGTRVHSPTKVGMVAQPLLI
jgi:hypothetical protein